MLQKNHSIEKDEPPWEFLYPVIKPLGSQDGRLGLMLSQRVIIEAVLIAKHF